MPPRELQRLQLMHLLGYEFYRLCDPSRRNDDQQYFDDDRCDYQQYQIPVGLLQTAYKVIERHDDGHLPRLLKTGRKSTENSDVIARPVAGTVNVTRSAPVAMRACPAIAVAWSARSDTVASTSLPSTDRMPAAGSGCAMILPKWSIMNAVLFELVF